MKKYFLKHLPDKQELRKSPYLRYLTALLDDTRLWHFNRYSVANAFALGMFAMWIPIPVQMVFVLLVAIPCRANLPLAIALAWVSNPITAPPMLVFCYWVGAWVLGSEVQSIDFSVSFTWLVQTLSTIWAPFLLGSFIMSSLSGALGYFAVRLSWHIYLLRSLRIRRSRQASKLRSLQK